MVKPREPAIDRYQLDLITGTICKNVLSFFLSCRNTRYTPVVDQVKDLGPQAYQLMSAVRALNEKFGMGVPVLLLRGSVSFAVIMSGSITEAINLSAIMCVYACMSWRWRWRWCSNASWFSLLIVSRMRKNKLCPSWGRPQSWGWGDWLPVCMERAPQKPL